MCNLVIRNSISIASLVLTLLAPFSSISIRQTGAQQFTRGHTDDSLGNYVAQAVPVEPGQAPRLDGRLDDPIWRTAPPARGFVQNEPE